MYTCTPIVKHIHIIRDSHLSDTTCLTHDFFKHGKQCSKPW